MVRRAALMLVLAFVAGPTTNARCLWSCWSMTAALAEDASVERCHGATNPDVAIVSAGEPCNPDRLEPSPFVKSAIAAAPAVGLESASAAPVVVVMIPASSAAARHATGPPGTRAGLPLRI